MAKTRANGEGSIRQRKDGTWEAHYTVGRNPMTGKQIQKSIYAKIQKELTVKLRNIHTDIENGTYIIPSKILLSDWLEQWLSNYVKITLSSTTYSSYKGLSYAHIIPMLGDTPLADLKPYSLQKFYKDLLIGGRILTKGKKSNDLSFSTATVHKIRNIMNEALDQGNRQANRHMDNTQTT